MGIFFEWDITIAVGVLAAVQLHKFIRPSFLTFRISRTESEGKHVVISGCDTGFGNLLARRLDIDGYTVHACCLTSKGCAELQENCSSTLQVYQIDITKQEDIDQLKTQFDQNGISIWGIVNNAGVYHGLPVELTSMEKLKWVMNVNCFGHIAMTKTLLPLVVRGGRVVNISSIVGRIAPPGNLAYSCSKFAMEAFSDTLRREMMLWGIRVSTIEPGYHRTNLTINPQEIHDKLWQEVDKNSFKRYGDDFAEVWKQKIVKAMLAMEKGGGGNPEHVVAAYAHALGSDNPKYRYVVGLDGWGLILLSYLPDWASDFILKEVMLSGLPLPTAAR